MARGFLNTFEAMTPIGQSMQNIAMAMFAAKGQEEQDQALAAERYAAAQLNQAKYEGQLQTNQLSLQQFNDAKAASENAPWLFRSSVTGGAPRGVIAGAMNLQSHPGAILPVAPAAYDLRENPRLMHNLDTANAAIAASEMQLPQKLAAGGGASLADDFTKAYKTMADAGWDAQLRTGTAPAAGIRQVATVGGHKTADYSPTDGTIHDYLTNQVTVGNQGVYNDRHNYVTAQTADERASAGAHNASAGASNALTNQRNVTTKITQEKGVVGGGVEYVSDGAGGVIAVPRVQAVADKTPIAAKPTSGKSAQDITASNGKYIGALKEYLATASAAGAGSGRRKKLEKIANDIRKMQYVTTGTPADQEFEQLRQQYLSVAGGKPSVPQQTQQPAGGIPSGWSVQVVQ